MVGPPTVLIMGPVILPWSIIAYVQGMRQAGRDWASLLDFIRITLASHALLED